MTENPDFLTWAMIRHQFPGHERLLSITPWGGDRAVIVTTDRVYIAEPNDQLGYTLTATTVYR
jgi:hypothetical protein